MVCACACPPRVYKPVYVHHCLLNDGFDLNLTLLAQDNSLKCGMNLITNKMCKYYMQIKFGS